MYLCQEVASFKLVEVRWFRAHLCQLLVFFHGQYEACIKLVMVSVQRFQPLNLTDHAERSMLALSLMHIHAYVR